MWLLANSYLFQHKVITPWLATADEDTVSQILSQMTAKDENYDSYKDDLIFDCENSSDARLFISLMSALGLTLNYSVSGQEYIANNTHQM